MTNPSYVKNPKASKAAFPTLQDAALHGAVGEIVRAIEPQTEAHPAAVLLHLLVGLGNLIGRSPYMIAGNASHHANLFAVIVGQSSKSRKGSSWEPVKAVLTELDQSWAKERIMGGLSSGEGVIYHVRNPIYGFEKDRAGTRQRVMIDPGENDKRLFVQESEFAQGLSAMSRKENILSPILRQAWDTGTLRTLIKNNPISSTDAHISIVAHITREELKHQLATCEFFNGFSNRFLWAITKRVRSLPEGGRFKVGSVSKEIAGLGNAIRKARQNNEVERSPDAKSLWGQNYVDLSKQRYGRSGIVCDRAEAQVLRLSLLYALVAGSQTVEVEHLQAATALWQYCEQSAKHIFGDDPANPKAAKILNTLKGAAPNGMSRMEISVQIFNRNISAAEIEEALSELSDSGQAFFKTVKTGGRHAERWFAVTPP